MGMNLKKLWNILCIYSVLDFAISLVLFILAGVFINTCEADSIYAIPRNVTLEQITFFYEALKECGYEEENSIPSSESICGSFNSRVLPFLIISGACNLFHPLLFQSLPTKHSNVLLYDGKHENRKPKVSRKVSAALLIITFGMVFAISFGIIGLIQYTDPRMCWLNYSIVESKKYNTQLIFTILISIFLAIYKPFEIVILWLYMIALHTGTDQRGSATINLAAQLEDDSESKVDVPQPGRKSGDEGTTYLGRSKSLRL